MATSPGSSTSSSLRFPGTSYGSSERCQGFASPRKIRAPLTPSRPSKTKSCLEESEGKLQRSLHPAASAAAANANPSARRALAYCDQKMVLTIGATLLWPGFAWKPDQHFPVSEL